MERIPDEAWIVRGGRNQPEDLVRATGTHPSGITGISVECSADKTIEELSESLPHGQIGVTTAYAVRTAGGDVLRTSGRSRYHATLTGLDPATISQLLAPTIPNPSKVKD